MLPTDLIDYLDRRTKARLHATPLQLTQVMALDGHYRGDSKDEILDRLLEMREEFASDENLTGVLVRRCVTVTCPYDGQPMEHQGGGSTQTFRCGCGAVVGLTLPVGGVVVAPGRETL